MRKSTLLFVILMTTLFSLNAGAEDIEQPQDSSVILPKRLEQKTIADQEWEKQADINQDGIVDSVEIHQWRQMQRQQAGSIVPEMTIADADRKQKADTNSDGTVDAAEMQQWRQQVKERIQEEIGSKDKAAVDTRWERKADVNKDGIVDSTEVPQWRKRRIDKDNNPPGPKGGPGTNWENPPGPKGGPGASPDRRRKY